MVLLLAAAMLWLVLPMPADARSQLAAKQLLQLLAGSLLDCRTDLADTCLFHRSAAERLLLRYLLAPGLAAKQLLLLSAVFLARLPSGFCFYLLVPCSAAERLLLILAGSPARLPSSSCCSWLAPAWLLS